MVGRRGGGHNGRMPWLLYRYILVELLKVFGISASVLVLVSAFGAAIQPLATEDLMGPLQTAKYILLAIVPMLQFALPFAAGFAATLVFYRLTADNEILAAAVGGISYQRILLPIAALGLALLVIMVLLTQWVIPRFWALMERIVATDVTRLVQTSIDKGLPVHFGDVQIYADRLRVQENPADTNAEKRLILSRVVAAELDDKGRIVTDVAARQAIVDIHRREGQTLLMLALVDTVAFNGRTGELVQTPQIKPPQPIAVPSPSRDDPLFMTFGQLRWLDRNPDAYSRVIDAKTRVAGQLRHQALWDHIEQRMRTDGEIELQGGWGGTDHRITVRADRFEDRMFRTDDGRPIEIDEFVGAEAVRRITAQRNVARTGVGSTLIAPAIDLRLSECEVTDFRSQGAVNRRAQLTLPDLAPVHLPVHDPSELPYRELLGLASGVEAATSGVNRLLSSVNDLHLNIKSGMARRHALSVMSVLLLLLGATLAMWLRDSLPLVIYIWSFVPSVLNIVLISGGHHMIRSGQVFGGFIVMWSGNALVLAVTIYVFSRLMRH